MVKIGDVVLYKKAFALVSQLSDGKIAIQTAQDDKSLVKVREKDIIALNLTAKTPSELFSSDTPPTLDGDLNDAYALLNDDGGGVVTFAELCDIVGYKTCGKCNALFTKAASSLEFSLDEVALKNGTISFKVRGAAEVQSLKNKAYEKAHESELFNEYIERVKKQLAKNKKSPNKNIFQKPLDDAKNESTGEKVESDSAPSESENDFLTADDKKRLQEVERVALGQSTFSKTMAAIHQKVIPEAAHKLLLDLGVWTFARNPYPARSSLPINSNTIQLPAPPTEAREEIPGVFYAIDNAYSADPDDAVGFDGTYLWVHIADAAAAITPGDKIDIAARNRGTTLYLPETTVRMLNEGALIDYALGLKSAATYGTAERSIPLDNALSFRIRLDKDGAVEECKVLKTKVRVARITYERADELRDTNELKPLFEIAARNIKKRDAQGAVSINLPEVHISVNNGVVNIEKEVHHDSCDMVREMMLLAGVGAAKAAFENKIPFPYVTQPTAPIASDVTSGLAFEYSKIRSMRPRALSTSPASHGALGLPMYTQVTSPLRRYIDLIAHEQLRLYLAGSPLIESDEMFKRIAESDLAMSAAKIASRKSDQHWTLVWLLQHRDWEGMATCVGEYMGEYTLIISELALWTKIRGEKLSLNEEVKLRLVGLDLATLRADFAVVK